MIIQSKDTTWLHGADPFSKGLSALLITTLLISTRELWEACLLTGIVIAVAIPAARGRLSTFSFLLPIVLGGTVSLVLFQSLVRPGPGIGIGPLTFSKEGAVLGIALVVRSVGIAACSIAFAATTRPKDVVAALVFLRVPFRIAYILYMALRFIPLFEEDARAIRDAQRLRGQRGFLRTFRSAAVALTATELRRVEETSIALEVRGFGISQKRTVLEPVRCSSRGVLLLLAASVFATCDIIYRVGLP